MRSGSLLATSLSFISVLNFTWYVLNYSLFRLNIFKTAAAKHSVGFLHTQW